MLPIIKAGAITLVAFIIVDFIWLGLAAAKLYQNQLGHLLNMQDGSLKANIPAAVATWILLVVGIMVFVVPRATESAPVLTALGLGALFGFLVYGVYDLTSYAVMKDWPFKIVIIDMLWGAFLCGISSALCAWLAGMFGYRF
jgi:uncharacterized membrane protein